MTIQLEVISKLPGQQGSWCIDSPPGQTVADLLTLLAIRGDWDEVFIVHNGRAASRDDCLQESGKVLLLPVLCGG